MPSVPGTDIISEGNAHKRAHEVGLLPPHTHTRFMPLPTGFPSRHCQTSHKTFVPTAMRLSHPLPNRGRESRLVQEKAGCVDVRGTGRTGSLAQFWTPRPPTTHNPDEPKKACKKAPPCRGRHMNSTCADGTTWVGSRCPQRRLPLCVHLLP